MSAPLTAEQEKRIREIVREELIDFAVMRSGLGHDNDEWQRMVIRADWDRFRSSFAQRGRSDA